MKRRQRRRSRIVLALALVATATLSFATTQAFTASNIVPTTDISQFTQTITPAQLAPSECASLAVTSIVAGTGTIAATATHQLVLGSSAVDTLSDSFGSVCMVGGAGSDTFNGKKNGGDLCIVSSTTQAKNVNNCTIAATRP
jgi:hypothetical protein